jgi:hypothetical protein
MTASDAVTCVARYDALGHGRVSGEILLSSETRKKADVARDYFGFCRSK